MMVTCNQKLVWHVVAVLLSAVGSILLFTDRFIIQQEVRREVTLATDSPYLSQWLNDSSAITAKFFIFNITNSHLVESGDDYYIHLQEIGPFVYHVKRQRNILTMNETTIQYQPISTFTYDRNLSTSVELDHRLSIVNIPLAVVIKTARLAERVIRRASSVLAVASRSHVFTRRSADEILFEGYRDPLFALVKAVERTARLDGADKIPDVFSLMKDVSDLFCVCNRLYFGILSLILLTHGHSCYSISKMESQHLAIGLFCEAVSLWNKHSNWSIGTMAVDWNTLWEIVNAMT